ncbi:TauD/TfdA family dioxygenase (plasmid) [Burkholderia sp. FERM BP-3421]|jgi:taurine dioxygenase|uniref:TauD/TfdA dioxygenase family protein n=1 Tax=Burkholderia sp. FERM BP-3421 TaxID=1494466 RepID=UPI00235F9B37|nr:TauD/TfdA family dioxygenase [Burkholderia sp. FERM BP-3421]WDD90709.1 TauD/TfdA family dioxygenase [Burkholderia sp. FERM BP-3421]
MSAGSALTVVPITPFGAEIKNVDLRDPTQAEIEKIISAWDRHGVLVFRNQTLSDDQLLAFSSHFGTLDVPPNQGEGVKSPPGYPNIFVVSNVRDAQGNPIGALGDGESAWHTDSSYRPDPPDASILYALELPAWGGDTLFANMKAALAALPPELYERVKGLDVKHDGTYDSSNALRKGMAHCDDPRAAVGLLHPLVIEHPVTRERAIYMGRRRNAYLSPLELDESERLINAIWAHVETAVYRHRWTVGDLLIWDNRMTMHMREAFDPASRRVMHRTQIRGTRPPRRPEGL